MAAARANQGWRETAPVEENQRLAIRFEMSLDSRNQRFAYTLIRGRARRVDQVDGRRLGVSGAARQPDEFVSTTAAMVEHLQRRRCRAKDDRYIEVFRAHDGKVTRRVAKPLLLLKGVIMFFIYDDQSRVSQWCKYCGTRADNKPCRSRPGGAPCGEPFDISEA
jgi:hypothetical protein